VTFAPIATTTDVDDLTWALRAFADTERPNYARYRRYLKGDHDALIANRTAARVFADLLSALRSNFCPAVVQALTDRFAIEGFVLHGDEGEDATGGAADAAWAWWQDLNLASVANKLHTEAVALGDTYLVVWPDEDGIPRPYPNKAEEFVHKHDSERPDVTMFAAKLWREEGYYRATLYYDDRIERYRSKRKGSSTSTSGIPTAQAFEPYAPEGESSIILHDYGRVPVFHFAFNSDTHAQGQSELHDVIPLQDLCNITIRNLALAGESAAVPQKVITGVELLGQDGEDEYQARLKAFVDRILTIGAPDARIHEFSAADLTMFTKVIDSFYTMVARNKGIPLSYFFMQGDAPSGEALKTAESRLVKRAEDTMLDFGETWAQVAAFALRIQGTAADAGLSTVWAEAVSRSENDEVERVAVKIERIGIPRTQGWRELNYTDQQITDMTAEKDQETAAAVERFDQAFDAGRVA
jgi:hypothetical protein